MPQYLQSPTVWLLFVLSFGATFLLTPLVIRLARRIGAVDVGGHRKVYQGNPMPLLGGLAVGLPFLLICLFGALELTGMFELVGHKSQGFIAMGLAGGIILGLGVFDDLYGLQASSKFLGQILAAMVICFSGHAIRAIEIPGIGLFQLDHSVGIAVTVLWIVGVTNAFNLIDGIDGLAAGLGLIAALGLAAVGILTGGTVAVLLSVALAGSLLAFLFFNFNPARIFLGDTGSMFIGFMLANISLLSSLKASGSIIFLVPVVLILSLPLLDTSTSMIRRYLRGRPIFSGDQNHIHHRLLRKGYSHRQVALTLYGVAALMGTMAIVISLAQGSVWRIAGLAGYVACAMGLIWLSDYMRPTQAIQLAMSRRRNQMFTAFAKYAAIRLSSQLVDSDVSPREILWLMCRELNLRWLEIRYTDGQLIARAHNDELVEQESQPDEQYSMSVHVRGQQKLILCFRPLRPLDEYARHDVQACLGNIFEQTRLSLPSLISNLQLTRQENEA